jgi:hypothetical protein
MIEAGMEKPDVTIFMFTKKCQESPDASIVFKIIDKTALYLLFPADS